MLFPISRFYLTTQLAHTAKLVNLLWIDFNQYLWGFARRNPLIKIAILDLFVDLGDVSAEVFGCDFSAELFPEHLCKRFIGSEPLLIGSPNAIGEIPSVGGSTAYSLASTRSGQYGLTPVAPKLAQQFFHVQTLSTAVAKLSLIIVRISVPRKQKASW